MQWFSHPSGALQGSVELPGDKSLSHRTAVLAGMAHGCSRIENFQVSGVTQAMLDALNRMGVVFALDGTTLTVLGKGVGSWLEPASPLDCRGSATTLRILAGALALNGTAAMLDGSAQLRARPMDRIVEPLRQMGVPIQSTAGYAPLQLDRAVYPYRALHLRLPVASAQVKTCLLLAAIAAEAPTTLQEPGPSRDHTERLLRHMGVTVESEIIHSNGSRLHQTTVHPPSRLAFPALNLRLPGDFSAAAFLVTAALITPGSAVTIRNVGLNPTRTGFLDVLLAMGADIQILAAQTSGGEPIGDLMVRSSELKGIEISGELGVRMIDEFPIFAVAAACAVGKTSVYDCAELRNKESDRIAGTCSELRKLGVDITERPDGFSILGKGQIPRGGATASHQDHRLAMALLVAGLAAPEPVVVADAGFFTESFPAFASSLQKLGAQITPEEVA